MSRRTEDSGHEGKKVWGSAIALLIIGLLVTLPFTGAPPPESVRIATGPEGGTYAQVGLELRAALAHAGIEAELVASAGSSENLAALDAGDVDIALVQGGMARAGGHPDLQGVASLYFEPLWIFVAGSSVPSDLGELAGRTIEVGGKGSGTRAVASRLLAANGIDGNSGTTLRGSAPRAAVDALLSGGADALFLVSSPRSGFVRELFEAAAAGSIHAVSLERAHAYSRHFPFLEPLTLTPGMIDIGDHLPAEAVELVAPTAGLSARADLHAAVVPLLLDAVSQRFSQSGLFEDAGEFPSASRLDLAPGTAALSYFASGRSFLYRLLPFQLAAALDRLKILLLPLITLLIPLFKLAPPVYRWRIRSRIFRWYQTIMRIEAGLRGELDRQQIQAAQAKLAELDEELRDVTVPLSYAEELYNLRMHLRLVKKDLEERSTTAAS